MLVRMRSHLCSVLYFGFLQLERVCYSESVSVDFYQEKAMKRLLHQENGKTSINREASTRTENIIWTCHSRVSTRCRGMQCVVHLSYCTHTTITRNVFVVQEWCSRLIIVTQMFMCECFRWAFAADELCCWEQLIAQQLFGEGGGVVDGCKEDSIEPWTMTQQSNNCQVALNPCAGSNRCDIVKAHEVPSPCDEE